jgi:hypothetical protein
MDGYLGKLTLIRKKDPFPWLPLGVGTPSTSNTLTAVKHAKPGRKAVLREAETFDPLASK